MFYFTGYYDGFDGAGLLQQQNGFFGVADRFARNLEQVPIWGFTHLVVFGVQDVHQPALGPPCVVLVRQAAPQAVGLPQQAAQDPHRVEQLVRIGGRMNVGLHHRAMDADLPAFFKTLDLGPIERNHIGLFTVSGLIILTFLFKAECLKGLSPMAILTKRESETESMI